MPYEPASRLPHSQDKEYRQSPASVIATVSSVPPCDVLRRWDALVRRTPGTDVTQLSVWARVRSTVGYSPLYVFAHCGGELAGGAQLLCRRLPVLGRVGYLPYGPVVDRTVSDWETVRDQVVQALHGVGRSHLRMLFVQPPEGADDISRGLLARSFRPSSAGIAPPGSIRIDLSEDLTQIRSRFGRRLRSWPNRWQARGVTVSAGDESDLPLLTRLMTHSAQRQGFTPPSNAYVETLYRELAATGNAALFIGRVHGRPVAADLVTICGEMIRGRLSGFERHGEGARLSVPAAIRWEIIKWGKIHGLRWLDFGGLSAATLDALLGSGTAGVVSSSDQPKLTFGGTPFRYPPAVELVVPAGLRLAYDLARATPRGTRALHRAQVALRRGSTTPHRSPQ